MSEEPRVFFASSDEPRMLSKANDFKTVKSAACMHACVRERHRACLFECERAVLVVRSTHGPPSALQARDRTERAGRCHHPVLDRPAEVSCAQWLTSHARAEASS